MLYPSLAMMEGLRLYVEGYVAMKKICLYFQVHQPYRMRRYSVFEIGSSHDYFDHQKNKEIMHRVAKKCYLPMNKLLLSLMKKHPGKIRISFSISGSAIEQFKEHTPEILESFKELADSKNVEFLSETYHHSLAYLYSKEEFDEQVKMHKEAMKENFGSEAKIFRNTELIYSNDIARYAKSMGFDGIIAEGADHLLGWRTPNHIYDAVGPDQKDEKNNGCPNRIGIKVLLKNYKLSDDIAFRFSSREWSEYPLTAKKYSKWLKESEGDIVNLFMDYETFGEHQWEETGIFTFFEELLEEIQKWGELITPSDAVGTIESKGTFDAPDYISWADIERDVSAWLGNNMQKEAAKELYMIEKDVKRTQNKELIDRWRKMQTSDHFYYMCTKHFADGDVHKYFNPYESPYEAFIAFMNILNDMILESKTLNEKINS